MANVMQIKKIHDFFEGLPKPFLTLFAFLLVLVIGSLDSLARSDISITILYIFPIILIAWYEGGVPAALLSLFSAVTWAISDLMSDHLYSHMSTTIWNGLMVLGIFLIVAFSMAALKKLSIKARERDYTDDLTGVSNIRSFYEMARIEISRSAVNNQPLTLAYIDIDNLSYVNDILGHTVGDYLLHEAARILKSTLRSADIVARLGGAKFAVLMPEMKTEEAQVAIRKVEGQLSDMIKRNGWPATFTIGVVTCTAPTCPIDRLIKLAEDLVSTGRGDGQHVTRYQIVNSLPAAI